jgi:hypothetical protein
MLTEVAALSIRGQNTNIDGTLQRKQLENARGI